MIAATISNANICGIFELDEHGTVLYSRAGHSLSGDPVGCDFFRDVATYENADDLRRHFLDFVRARRAIDGFGFDFRAETGRAENVHLSDARTRDGPGS